MEDTSMHDSELFADETFLIIPNSLSEDALRELRNSIRSNGGTQITFDASVGRIDKLEQVKYIISETSDFPDYYKALELMVNVVKPSWVEASIKANKVKNPRCFSPDPALFMNDVVICCGDLPQGDKEAIEGGVLATGGQYTGALSKMVTHLIALNMEDARCQLAVSKRLHLQIVLPHWFDDCLRVGRRISERPYTLPDPEILDVEAGAIPPTRVSQQIRDASRPDPGTDAPPPTPPPHKENPRAIKAFAGKKIMLGNDLGLGEHLKGVITGLIKAGGGDMTSDVNEAHIYVCNYREGSDYINASQAEKDVGNLSWLYYLITHDKWTNPMRRMLHYPRPRNGIPGFGRYKISISSYTGEARVYLESLVKATGAEFTKTFKQDNSHLVAAHKNSEKCEAATEWNVHIVNHLWLEESYAKCVEQTLTDNKYTYFPPRTNLGEVLGQTELDRKAVEQHYFSKNPTKNAKTTKSALQPNGVPGSSFPPARAPSDPATIKPPAVRQAKRSKSSADIATPKPSRQNDEKENQTPGSRGAKDRAISKLHDSAPDIAKFEKEMKRKGGLLHGGRHPKESEKTEKTDQRASTSSKRSIDAIDGDEGPSMEDAVGEHGKKNKKPKLGPMKYRMLISKDDRWQDNAEKESKDKARLRELGIFITDKPKDVDILCAPKPVRTKKFVAALAAAPILVSTSFLDYALKHNKIPPPEKHPLPAAEFEKNAGFSLSESITRAQQNNHRLLKTWTIFCTANISGGLETYKDIIEANGGKCQMWKPGGRATSQHNATASKRKINHADKELSQNQQEDETDTLYLISDAHKSEFNNWKKFRELAELHDMTPRIVKTEWILFVAMAQYVHWKPEWELTEDGVKAATRKK